MARHAKFPLADVVAADARVCVINTSLTSEAGTFGTACALYISRFIGVSRQRPLSSGTCGAPPSPWTGLGRWMGLQELMRKGAGRHAHGHDHHGAESPHRQWGAGREGQGWTRPGGFWKKMAWCLAGRVRMKSSFPWSTLSAFRGIS